MSRFNNNRGGMGMNNFQPRRGGGVGGPMRGGLMGNPHMRSHPFQNQNRRGLNNFNRQPNQGPPQTPSKQQNQPILPPPSPGPALTMKGPMEQQKATEKEQGAVKQQTPVPPSTIQSTPAMANVTSQHQENKNQDQQLKSQVGNANGQQQKQLPQASPKATPQQPLRPGMQQGQRSVPQQGQRPGPQQGQRLGPQQGQRLGPQQGQRSGQQQGQKTAPMAMKREDGQETMALDNTAAQADGSQAKVCFCFIIKYYKILFVKIYSAGDFPAVASSVLMLTEFIHTVMRYSGLSAILYGICSDESAQFVLIKINRLCFLRFAQF